MAPPHRDVLRLAKGEAIRPSSDPEAFVTSAFEHRLGGLLWSGVERGEIELPEALGERVAIADLRVTAHHQGLWAGLDRLETDLRALGVAPVSLKGVTAEARWYDRLGERPCSDLDIWVTPADQGRLDSVLDLFQIDAEKRRRIIGLVRGRKLQHIDILRGQVAIDLHFDPMKLGMWIRSAEDVAQRCVAFEGHRGVRTTVLSPEDSLVLFLLHLNKDRFAYVGAAVDVQRVIDRGDLDWDAIHRFVAAEGLQVPVYRSLAAIASVLDLDVPAMARSNGLRAVVWERLWREELRFLGHEGRIAHPRRQALLPGLARGRKVDALKEWRRQLLPSKDLLEAQGVAVGHGPLRTLTTDRWHRMRERSQRRASARANQS